MFFSLYGFITTCLLTSILAVIFYFIAHNFKLISEIGLNSIMVFMILTGIRLLLPFEFLVSMEINLSVLFPAFYSLICTPIVSCLLIFIWIGGAVFFFIKSLKSYLAFTKAIMDFEQIHCPEVEDIIDKLSDRYGDLSKIKVVQSTFFVTPMLFGILRPVIILPKINLSYDEISCILEHEVAHYRHHDLIIKSLYEIVCIIYWWNPLIHILRKEISNVLELNIDVTVTNTLNELKKISYMQCILNIAKMHQQIKPHFTAISLVNANSHLYQRFEMVFNFSVNKSGFSKNIINFILWLIFFVSFFLVFQPNYSSDMEKVQDTFVITPDNGYFVKNSKNGYDLYLDGHYTVTIDNMVDSCTDIIIYDSKSEVPFN